MVEFIRVFFMKNMVNPINYQKLSIVLICLHVTTIFMLVATQPVIVVGEAGTYVLGTAALQYNRSIFITHETVTVVQQQFPAFGDIASWTYQNNHFPRNSITGEFVNVSWYFPAYSASVIPVSIILKILGLNQSYAFMLSNALFVIISLISVFKFLKANDKTKFMLILALGLNPILFYIIWPSAEVFIFMFVVLSLIFYFNKSYKRSAFFLTIAGAMNITIMALGFFMIASFFVEMQMEKGKGKNIIRTILDNFSHIIKYALSFSLLFIAFIYNFIASAGQSILTPQAGLVASVDTTLWIDSTGGRMIAYLFDLNFGLLIWFPILLCFYFAVLVVSIFERRYQYFLLAAGHLAVTFAFSMIFHINSGMTGIARYNVWVAPLMIFAFIVAFPERLNITTNSFVEKISFKISQQKLYVVVISSILTGFLIWTVGLNFDRQVGFTQMLPSARFVLDRAPSMYNPLFSTFISRVEQRDGGYDYREPVFYFDSRNQRYIRKILVSHSDLNNLTDMVLFGDYESRTHFENQLDRLASRNSRFGYINIPPRYRVTKAPPLYYLGTILHFSGPYENASLYFQSGLFAAEPEHTWSIGYESIFTARLNKSVHSDLGLHIVFDVFWYPDGYQTIRLYAGYSLIYEKVFYHTGYWQNAIFRIPNEAISNDGILELRFVYPNAVSPYSINPAYLDQRVLAIGFREMTISQWVASNNL